jgi:hypothetical protein
VNGRINADATAEGRLAAVAKSLCYQMQQKLKRDPDYADFRDVLRPFVLRELLMARVDEARKLHGAQLTVRIAELSRELAEITFPSHDDLKP